MSSTAYTESVANSIIKQLKEGTAPWIKPWEAGQHFRPYNPSTGKDYKGINALVLMSKAEDLGYGDSRWMTFKQAGNLDARVNKGEKSTTIQYWKWTEEQIKKDENGKPVFDESGQPVKEIVRLEQPSVFWAKVFNADQLTGLAKEVAKPLLSEPQRHEQAESLLQDSGADIIYQPGNRAFYRPSTDTITLPKREQFQSADGFYATAFHELGHWTGHESRLNRDLAHPFGSQGYAREELRAEIASLMLGEKLEIGHDPSQHTAYIGSWIKALEEDPREIFRAASDSEKIMTFITGREFQQRQEQAQEQDANISIQMPSLQAATESQLNTSNERIYLAVPYTDKGEAKALGAQWDRAEKCWFAPPGTDLTSLEPWLPRASEHLHVQVGPEPREAFAVALADSGLQLSGLPEMNGQLQRVAVQGDDRGQKSGAYIGFTDGHPAGFIQNFKTGEQINWKLQAQTKALNAVDRARLSAEAAQKRQDRANEQERQHMETAKVIEAHWNGATSCEQHPYLERKGVEAYGIRIDDVGTILLPPDDPKGQHWSDKGNLLVPIRDINGTFWGAQSIDAEGNKSFPKGSRKYGGHHVIGELGSNESLLFAEGYATAATLHELTGLPVVVTFDSGNLPTVAEAYREKYPEKTLIIAGDNDHTKPLEKNVGLQKAEEAAKKVNGHTLLPNFEKGASGSDWNDLVKLKSNDAVNSILQAGIQLAEMKHQASAQMIEQAKKQSSLVAFAEKEKTQVASLSL
jgi:antirestriction protein ArdC/phage/plasmid primase-like uncharacterized protein